MDAKPTNKILAEVKNMKNSSTSSFFLKTVNHLVTYSEVSIIQSLPSVSACKNHLVIVWTIQLSPDENRHKPKSVIRACLDFGILEGWILFGF